MTNDDICGRPYDGLPFVMPLSTLKSPECDSAVGLQIG
jgi:hypothetical protein